MAVEVENREEWMELEALWSKINGIWWLDKGEKGKGEKENY